MFWQPKAIKSLIDLIYILLYGYKIYKKKSQQTTPKFEGIAIATENELITFLKVIVPFVTKSIEVRYIDLLNTPAKLFQRVPQQYIASFLGVSPETLS